MGCGSSDQGTIVPAENADGQDYGNNSAGDKHRTHVANGHVTQHTTNEDGHEKSHKRGTKKTTTELCSGSGLETRPPSGPGMSSMVHSFTSSLLTFFFTIAVYMHM